MGDRGLSRVFDSLLVPTPNSTAQQQKYQIAGTCSAIVCVVSVGKCSAN